MATRLRAYRCGSCGRSGDFPSCRDPRPGAASARSCCWRSAGFRYVLLPSLLAVASSWRTLEHVDWLFAVLVLVCEAASYVCLWELDRIALQTRAWFPVAAAQLSGNV